MNKPLRSLHILTFAAGILVGFPSASPAQVKVLMSGGFSAAYQELLPEFQNTTGITVTTAHGASQGDGPNTIGAQLRRGVPADMVILSRGGLAELIAEGRIAIGSEVNLAQVPLGVGVRAGAPRPNIGTVDAFKQALLRAKSVGTQSSSTIYMTTKLFPQLGIASAMAGKLLDGGVTRERNPSGPRRRFRRHDPSRDTVRPGVCRRCVERCEGTRSIQTAHRLPRVGKGYSCDREDGDETPGGTTRPSPTQDPY